MLLLALVRATYTEISTNIFDHLSYNHTKRQAQRQAAASSEASEFGNGSEVDLEHQVEHHIQVNGDMSLPLTLPLDAWCGYTLITNGFPDIYV